MNTKNSFINKWTFIIFSKIPTIFFFDKKKKELHQEILENIKKSKIVNHPIHKNFLNFYFVSNEINKLINAVDTLINDRKKNKILVENCLNLYYLLITYERLKPSILKRNILSYVEEKISKILENNKNEDIDNKIIPYSIYIRKEKSIYNLINELNTDCSNYLKKINNIKTKYLIIDKNEINIDSEWKNKHEYIFNKNKLKIPISKHNYEFILYAINESNIRREVVHLLNTPYKNKNLNNDIINILKKRYEIANKAGYDNWSHYSMYHFTSEKNNYDNLGEFFSLIKNKINKDYEKINSNIMKQFNLKKNNIMNNNNNNNNNNNKLDIYDWNYYYNKISNKSDEYLINTFFPQHCVLNNFIEIISRIYGFSYEKISNKETLKKWPSDSIIYKIEGGNQKRIKYNINYEKRDNIKYNDDVLLGYIYIIPYMNITLKDYFKIPSMNSLSNTYLICNGHVLIDYKFIRTLPIEKKLFSSSEILTLFHEFGHAYHLLLLSKKFSLRNFYNIPLDYAEFFSHINEHLVNNYNIVYNLSNNQVNNSKINENLFKSMKFDSSRLFNIYLQSIIDYTIHNINPFTFFSNDQENHDEDDLNMFYKIIEKHLPYNLSSSYTIHSTSFPYHFSCYYAGSVLSYLLAELRVTLTISTNNLSLKKNNSLISFQNSFYNILSKDFGDENFPSIIKYALSNKNLLFDK